MIKELEKRIEHLKKLRENFRIASDKALESKDVYLQGAYDGERIRLLEEIQYLQKLVAMLKGE